MYNYRARMYQDRTGFVFPFLVGALGGGAAVGLTRPRPVYVNQPYPMGYQPYPTYPPYSSYYSGYYYQRPF